MNADRLIISGHEDVYNLAPLGELTGQGHPGHPKVAIAGQNIGDLSRICAQALFERM